LAATLLKLKAAALAKAQIAGVVIEVNGDA
jgi:hypothetical protein